ncbi:cell wall-binding repeat-containing protein [Jeotgalibacillus sp. ET6]|uniref:cell wall-binding repeat-containing protein n=1 Tax=Jeotgalibacillus sp. ET6 TaxID=3037260 RepID=UPI0024184B94|nr:cell wall-binding repeat-containing protein [Jeotgalibacillus sp. ET6]MDG5471575.1 cell wall-binding repeat-containing protein [Jeotgalibacillus sp. ET6]
MVKMKKKSITSYMLSGIIVLFIAFNLTETVSANENSLIFPEGETVSEINDSFKAKVNNGMNSTISISSHDQSFYEKAIDFGRIEALYATEMKDKQYFTLVARLEGSGTLMNFTVLEVSEGTLKEIYTSPFYERASYEILESSLEVTYPVLNDNGIDPTETKTDQYTYGKGMEQGIVKERSEHSNFSIDSAPNASTSAGNPSPSEINRILTEEAVKRNMPPEIVKAIAYQESNFQQHWTTVPASIRQGCTPEKATNPNYLAWDGSNVKLGYDCIGIGIMQVSDWRFISDQKKREEYVDRLKNDIRFNIQEGLNILEYKWKYATTMHTDGKTLVPAVNDMDRRFIDNWYFAAFAYNGMLSRNDPTANGTRPYQERIYEHISNHGLIDVTPFPANQLKTHVIGSLLRFEKDQYDTARPLTMSKSQLKPGDKAFINEENVRFRSLVNIDSTLSSLPKGTRVTVLSNKPAYPNTVYGQYTFVPVKTDSGLEGYVASSYLTPASYSLSGASRYETGVSISNFGWENQRVDALILGRGDLPIDSLTGSVLAANKRSPLLLTTSNTMHGAVMEELKRLNPKTVYVLGGQGAISPKVVEEILALNIEVIRVTGVNRYETAVSIANTFTDSAVNEIFLATGNEESPDALSIAAYAGSTSTPILLTSSHTLRDEVKNFISTKKVKKVTIIGGTYPVSKNVENQLRSLGVTVERVSGKDRYDTSVAIADKYFGQQGSLNSVFFARGDIIVDALSGSALAAKYGAPLILTKNSSVPAPVTSWMNSLQVAPTLFYLGSDKVIKPSVRESLEQTVIN